MNPFSFLTQEKRSNAKRQKDEKEREERRGKEERLTVNLSFCLARCLSLGSTETGDTNNAGSSSSIMDARLPSLPAVLRGEAAFSDDVKEAEAEAEAE